MEDGAEAADDERVVELSSIAAIYPEIILDSSKPFDAKLDLQVAPINPLKIRFTSLASGAPPDPTPQPPRSPDATADVQALPSDAVAIDAVAEDIHTLTYLPPLSIHVHLPDGYPTEIPPAFTVSTTPAWLSKQKIDGLINDCVQLWEEYGRDQVVFACIDHFQQQAESAFGTGSISANTLSVSRDLKIALLDFDMQAKRERFEKESFNCGICLEPKKGSVCHRMLACSHVFCVSCLQDFYNSCISEGDVDNVKCLDPTCGKETNKRAAEEQADPAHARKRKRKDPALNPSELLQIPLAPELVQRYVHLKRKKRLESDMTTVYCPRQWCQGAARSKKHPKPFDPMADNDQQFSESEQENDVQPKPKTNRKKGGEKELPPMSERLRICEDCSYAFCCVCKKGWHGELAFCRTRKQAELNAEEKASADYLKLHTTGCPTCAAPSQKTMGCNHMICFKCKTHFCYLCSSFIMEDNPYTHFNDPKGTCYMRLWELEGGDGGQIDHRFNGGIDDWIDEETDDEDDEDDDDDDIDDSDDVDTDELPEGPNFFFNAERLFDHSDDSDSEDDIWPGLPQQPANQEVARPREPRIEIINFAQAGVRNPRHIALQGQANGQPINNRNGAQMAPPPAPAPPQRNNNRRGDRQMPLRPHLPENAAGNLGVEIEAEGNQRFERAVAAPGQGNHAIQPAPLRAMGLERFLELARDNREDEWDSDELEEDFAARGPIHDNW